MAFDVGAGLAQVGQTVSQVAGAGMLEQQRSALEQQRMQLADQLAGARQEKQNLFTKGEREATQTFQSGEKEKDRTFQAAEGDKTRATQIQTAGISAGASRYNADIQRQTQIELQKMRESADPEQIKIAKALEKFSPEQWDALRKFNEVQREKKAPPEYQFGWEPDPDKPGAFRPTEGGPRDPEYLARIEEGKRKAEKGPAGFRYKTDGSGELEFIPGGPADPSIVKRASPMNNEQARDAGFADRMANSQTILSKLDVQGTSAWNRLMEGAGKGGNYLQSDEYQQFRQAKEDFINAQLRRESGAAISKDEFDKADRQYFPQPGDAPETIKQKAKNRQLAVDAMIRGAGPAYKPGANVGEGEQPAAKFQQGTYKGPDNKPVSWSDIRSTAEKHGLTTDEVILRLGLQPVGAR